MAVFGAAVTGFPSDVFEETPEEAPTETRTIKLTRTTVTALRMTPFLSPVPPVVTRV